MRRLIVSPAPGCKDIIKCSVQSVAKVCSLVCLPLSEGKTSVMCCQSSLALDSVSDVQLLSLQGRGYKILVEENNSLCFYEQAPYYYFV